MGYVSERTLLDRSRVNGYDIFHWSDDTYTAYDKTGSEIYTVARREDNNFVVRFETKTGSILPIVFDGSKPFDFEMIKPNSVVYSRGGQEVTIENNVVTKRVYESGEVTCERFYNDENFIENQYNKDGDLVFRETLSVYEEDIMWEDFVKNETTYFDDDGNVYRITLGDGTEEYYDGEDPIYLRRDGTFSYMGFEGTYTINHDGHFVCIDKETNNKILFDTMGHKYRMITPDGTICDYDKESQISTRNGKTSYSKINHIEYDEEEYDNLLKQLISIHDEVPEKINSDYQTSIELINSFEDKCSTAALNEANSAIQTSIEKVNELKETINYSLLAYQACDNDLKGSLNILVDSLFEENESGLATVFKREVANTIEDRDNDQIMEYKSDTDFNSLSQRAIVYSCYIDENGNKLYLSRISNILGMEGDAFNLTFQGTPFTLTRDQDGILKLKDQYGKDVDIFGEYNVSTWQYGSNQMFLEYSYKDRAIRDMLNNYYPDATMEEKIALLGAIKNNGCGYAAVTNLIFKEFEGNENGFYKAYGFPMYNITKLVNENCYVDYNYEPVMIDLFCKTIDPQGTHDINYAIMNAHGLNKQRIEYVYDYLQDTKGVTLGTKLGVENVITDRGYYLRTLEGEIQRHESDSAGHMMVITGHDEDGNTYVSSWGQKMIYMGCIDEKFVDIFENTWKGVVSND